MEFVLVQIIFSGQQSHVYSKAAVSSGNQVQRMFAMRIYSVAFFSIFEDF